MSDNILEQMRRDAQERSAGSSSPVVAPLSEAVAIFRRWLELPDPGALYAVLAAVVANRMPGDPVWLMIVGPPGGGKTELLTPLIGLPHVYPAATLTEAALLSGTPKKDAGTAKGGLLREIGDFGIIIAKDFGSVLSMHRDSRAAILAAFREVYDGSWTRHVGTDGGRTLSWTGKVGMIAACTPAIDSHHAVMGAMGERFALYRMTTADPDKQARRALAHVGHEHEMRKELTEAVQILLASIDPGAKPAAPFTDVDRLVALAGLAVRCRSAVERDGYTREVQLIPEAESPGRLALVLARMDAALTLLGVDDAKRWQIVRKIALDGMPALRRAVLEHLATVDQPIGTRTLAEALGYPTSTARRACEDLAAHGLLERTEGTGNKGDDWTLTAWTRTRWACVPETSQDLLNTPLRIRRDKSGTQDAEASA